MPGAGCRGASGASAAAAEALWRRHQLQLEAAGLQVCMQPTFAMSEPHSVWHLWACLRLFGLPQ